MRRPRSGMISKMPYWELVPFEAMASLLPREVIRFFHCKNASVHKLKSLSEDNCWTIIKAKAFREGDIIPPEFEAVGKNIAKRCQGLPLAAKVVGGMFLDKSKDEWLSIQDTWLSNFGGDGNTISKILKLSFDRLSPPSLKKCFACCSIFPKHVLVARKTLVELWMAEGLLRADQGNDMESVGNKYFNLLLQNSLLQVVERDEDGNMKFCNMHDLVHDLACSVLGTTSIWTNGNVLDEIYQARYITVESLGSRAKKKKQNMLGHYSWKVKLFITCC
ncbi:putative disease resistance protein RGA1 [Sesamum angolense]|uniref:Disease resistance protein RGA1 n=1 Tax=Sesamum angolense TaxID=2727404 RepID=A0AAE2C229_9LAMI|nr:putative disease resistance protein RGA1 [Sesamum angolense]